MADKTLKITNNGTGTLTLGGVTIDNSSIATYSSSNKKISIVGTGTTNAAINLNYIKGAVSKSFNRNFNITGKEDANTTFRNKVKALMEEYKYAVVSGGLYVNYPSEDEDEHLIEYTETTLNVGSILYIGDSLTNKGNIVTYTYTATAVNYNMTTYTNIEERVNLTNDDIGNSITYTVTINHTPTDSNTIYGRYTTSGAITSTREIGSVMVDSTTLTYKYNLTFYYPSSGKTYEYTSTYNKAYVNNLFSNPNPPNPIIIYPKITNFSIQNLYGTKLTTRILDTLYV